MTDAWLKVVDSKKIGGAVLLDFSAAFNVIDHNLLLKKPRYYLHPLPYYGLRVTYLI